MSDLPFSVLGTNTPDPIEKTLESSPIDPVLGDILIPNPEAWTDAIEHRALLEASRAQLVERLERLKNALPCTFNAYEVTRRSDPKTISGQQRSKQAVVVYEYHHFYHYPVNPETGKRERRVRHIADVQRHEYEAKSTRYQLRRKLESKIAELDRALERMSLKLEVRQLLEQREDLLAGAKPCLLLPYTVTRKKPARKVDPNAKQTGKPQKSKKASERQYTYHHFYTWHRASDGKVHEKKIHVPAAQLDHCKGEVERYATAQRKVAQIDRRLSELRYQLRMSAPAQK